MMLSKAIQTNMENINKATNYHKPSFQNISISNIQDQIIQIFLYGRN